MAARSAPRLRRRRDFFLERFLLAPHCHGSGLILVGLYMGVYFALWSWLAGLLRPQAAARTAQGRHAWPPSSLTNCSPEARSPWLSSLHNLWLALVLAAAWTALEWVRGWMFSGWGWNGLGVALHNVLPVIQIAEYTGVAGLSFLVAFAQRHRDHDRAALHPRDESAHRGGRTIDFTLTMAAIVGLCGLGIRSCR